MRLPCGSNPERLGHLKTDITKALRLLQRSSSVSDYMLDADAADHDVNLLTTPGGAAFLIETEEEQVGALQGRIALRYLGVPAFTDRNGFSGGALVTSYAHRTHPLHAPTVMADVRLGRYIRDNVTGEWCIITRNGRDNVTRLQYMRVKDNLSRERICLTCTSDLFNKGDYFNSVLFQCHDHEWRLCPYCGSPPSARCTCVSKQSRPTVPVGLKEAAASVMKEGPASWVGKVRVTVCSNVTESSLLNLDALMDVRSSYQPSMDAALAADMQRLAIYEQVTSRMQVPAPLTRPQVLDRATIPVVGEVIQLPVREEPKSPNDPKKEESQVATAPRSEQDVMEELECLDLGTRKPPNPISEGELPCSSYDLLLKEFDPDVEMEDDILHMAPLQMPTFLESTILPADPSTLPGGIELCMDGMDMEEDWCSMITQEKDGGHGSPEHSTSPSFEEEEEKEEIRISLHGEEATVVESVNEKKQDQDQQQVEVQSTQEENSVQQQPQKQQRPKQSYTQYYALPAMINAHPQHLYQPLMQQEQGDGGGFATMAGPVQPRVSFAAPRVESKKEAELQIVESDDIKPDTLSAQQQQAQPLARGKKLAPRPAGMGSCADGFIWQMGAAVANGNTFALAARLEAIEKERKAEERRKKNRQAAARSNARKKTLMDGIKSEIKDAKARVEELRQREIALRRENQELKRKMGMSV